MREGLVRGRQLKRAISYFWRCLLKDFCNIIIGVNGSGLFKALGFKINDMVVGVAGVFAGSISSYHLYPLKEEDEDNYNELRDAEDIYENTH